MNSDSERQGQVIGWRIADALDVTMTALDSAPRSLKITANISLNGRPRLKWKTLLVNGGSSEAI